ncbi:glucoamylase [Erwinia sp. OLTSP20]|uniref:glycoside hydrolase family 15 protein n=1 Tax=unclassified Erwinia TaxID=2622719 RepID=UPI000C17AC76|nr:MULTISPECIES: glycoside hydrolase family 15 protein [unclassified Erwinia]PIJ48708.1 glucoamylase [Erwinia sp. OAMSP11]PIJ69331.1 glucoamylase [Erwinia sp. OLSSP12]PIJ79165.1 glucoamylase [Erwinia sp. OLCASP19]PIJ80691.1 glucoamylase [Erwinia sp. OLMTSP26]PIJ82841.1 glucoamylase [Erwinia sp. OLMDSP33]
MNEVKRHIGDHGVIGDLRTCALVASDGTIDYLCWPDLDSPSVFSALLDSDNAGLFSISPTWENARQQQIYLPDSNILQTRWLGEKGVAELTDYMPLCQQENHLPRIIRRIKAVKGEVTIALRCAPVHDYARAPTTLNLKPGFADFSAPQQTTLRLRSPVKLSQDGQLATARFTLKAGESAEFIFGAADDPALAQDNGDRCFHDTLRAWQRWSQQSTYQGRWREAVNRSALVLKLLTSWQHGSIAAAATFGLPEEPGGERNWDYRASWIRDASFSMYALMRLGYVDEARHFTGWVARCVENSHQQMEKLQVMYRLDSGTELKETTLDNLTGYAGSRPVRIGNDAWRQSQLDIYGELMDAIYLANKYSEAISYRGWSHVCRMIDYLCENWQQPDAGIWEMRGEPEHFLHSRLMCWVALDRAIRLGEKRSLSMPYQRWNDARNAIRSDIWQNFWHAERGHFTSTRHGQYLDASMLLMPLVRFVSATDPDWLATLDAIKTHLVSDGLVRRYNIKETPADKLNGEEGSFVACSFWYVECLARAGRLNEAHFEFEKLLKYASPLGLYAEEFNSRGFALGNFPQALSHLALISAAFFLNRKLNGTDPLWQP